MKWFLRMLGVACLLGVAVCCSDSNSDTSALEEEVVIDGTVYSAHYVQTYVEVERLSVIPTGDHVTVHCTGAKFDGSVLGASFGDNGFNDRIAVNSTKAISNRFASVDLVCDSDFDEHHKAGTSLSDVAFLAGVSPYAYIRSAYTETYDWKKVPDLFEANSIELNFRRGYFPVCKRLSEVGVDDLILLDPVFCLFLESPSTSMRACQMTLILTDDKGKKISTAFDWPAGK